MLKNKRANEVNNDGRTEGEKRQVDKIHTNACGLYTKLFAQPRAHAKQLKL